MRINTTKQTWVKPKVTVHELKLHSLLGENGWLNNSKTRGVVAWVSPTNQ